MKIYVFLEIAYKPSLLYFASFSDTHGRILTNDPDPESPEVPAPSYVPQTPEKRAEGFQKKEKLLTFENSTFLPSFAKCTEEACVTQCFPICLECGI